MENQVKEIARRIAELRQITGHTPEYMAEVHGISAAEYLKAENGDVDFSYTFMHKCAKVFAVDVSELISGEAPKLFKYQITRKGEGLPLKRESEFEYDHLAANVKNRKCDPFIVTAKYDPALANGEIPLSSHSGEEMSYVVEGRLKFQIGDHVEILEVGDCAYYNSSIMHGMVAIGGGDAKFVAIVMEEEAVDVAKAAVVDVEKTERVRSSADAVYRKYVDREEDENGCLKSISFNIPENFNFAYDVVDEIAKKAPNKTAMMWVSETFEDRNFTFGDMKTLSDKCANYFLSMGIKRGDKVMLVLRRHYQFWIAIIALHKIGAVVIPATDQLLAKDYVYRFNKAGVTAVVATAKGVVTDEIDKAQKDCPSLKLKFIAGGEAEGYFNFDLGVEFAREQFARRDTLSSDPMLMYFTSGTTSYPKIAEHDFTYPLGHFVTAKYWHQVREDGLHFTISDTGWGKSVWGKLYGQWLCEAGVFTYDMDRFKASDILPMIAKYQITTFCAPPTMYRFFIKEDLSKYDFSSVKHTSIAGEALNPEVFDKFKQLTGLELYEGFGQTETTLVVANLFGTTPKPGSMGKPNPQYNVELLAGDGTPAKLGEPGELCLNVKEGKTVGMFAEYYLDPEKTADALYDGYYHTGDMAWEDEDGYLWYVGRIDDLIKSSGYRIGPFEIESVIMELPYVLECAVTGVPDEVRGQVVKASIVLSGVEASEELKKEIQEYVKKHTAPYKYPRIIEFMEELPKTISGKIRRVELRNTENK
ncbi:MAG: AMP-binding protein [Bacillota bacterium]